MHNNNAYLTTMGPNNSQRQHFSDYIEKANSGNMRSNDMKTRKVHVEGNKSCPGKELRLYAQ